MDGHRILTFNEKMENPPTNVINAGCYIFNRSIFERIPEGRVVSIERETFPDLLADGANVSGYLDSSYWLDIGTPGALLAATRDLISGQAQSTAFDELLETGSYHRLNGSLISGTASVSQEAQIRNGSLISHGAEIGAGAIIEGSVIGTDTRIGAKSQLVNTFVAANSEIPTGFIASGQFFGFSRKK